MNEHLSKIINHPLRVPVSVGVVAFGAGVGFGYILGRRNREEAYEVPAQLEFDFNTNNLAEIRERKEQGHPVYLPAVEEPTDGEAVDSVIVETGAEFVAKKLTEAPPIKLDVEPDPENEIPSNIFAADNDDWDYAEEVRHRTKSDPYVIHRDEFFGDEEGYSQITLTYYEGDNIMADEDETPVYNFSAVTGPLLFGHGSGDPNVFYVRNDKRRAEYEILRDSGLFSVEVLGLEIEDNQRVKDLKHSNIRKFKME